MVAVLRVAGALAMEGEVGEGAVGRVVKPSCVGLLAAWGALVLSSDCFAQDPGAAYFDCIKARVCRGLATDRHCVGVGFFCDDDNSCIPKEDGSPDGCKWTWVYYCDGPTLNLCRVLTVEYWSTNCGPACRLFFYNHCVCSCTDLGGGFEVGFQTYCVTEKP